MVSWKKKRERQLMKEFYLQKLAEHEAKKLAEEVTAKRKHGRRYVPLGMTATLQEEFERVLYQTPEQRRQRILRKVKKQMQAPIDAEKKRLGFPPDTDEPALDAIATLLFHKRMEKEVRLRQWRQKCRKKFHPVNITKRPREL